MIVSLIVAMDRKRAIGIDNRLPWRLSADLKNFRELTMGHHIIMGRKTFESIGKPLPGRQTIIITRAQDYRQEGCLVAHSVEEALGQARERGEAEAFIIGGASIYAESLSLADRIYLTLVHADVEADTFFPECDAELWAERSACRHDRDEKNQYPFTYKVLERVHDRGSDKSSG